MEIRILNPDADLNWRISDELWARIEPLLPPGKPHRFKGHNPAVSPRKALDAIFFVLRTGCQWNALNVTGICHSSSAHRAFQKWVKAGVFAEMWRQGLMEYDDLKGIDWEWLAMDGEMNKAPLGGEKNRAESDGSRQTRGEALGVGRRQRYPLGYRDRRR